MVPARSLLKIARVVAPALAAVALALWAASLLPRPWSFAAEAAVVALALAAALLALDIVAPGVNLFSRALQRLPASAGAGAVALTFDDGPVEPYTRQVLDALERHGARATFFCIGENIERAPELAREIVRRGHTLGNHTQTHRLLPGLAAAEIERQIEECARTAERVTGVRPRLLRCPKGYKGVRVARAARRLGLSLVGFGYPIYDVQNPPAAQLVARVLGRVAPGDIVLMHDGVPPGRAGSRSSLVEALPGILAGLRERGLRPIALGEPPAGGLEEHV